MPKNLLLVTADANFAKVLLQGLGQEGHRVHVVKGKGEAVVRADENNCTLAFLDLDLGEQSVTDIGLALRRLNPNIRLVLFSDADTPPALDPIRPWTLQRKPHYLPELITMLNQDSTPLSKPTSTPARPVQASDPTLPWLQDVTKA